MSLSNAQKSKLVQILGRSIIEINTQLAAYSEDITAEMETDIGTQITRWTNGTVKSGVWFEGTESNRGFNTGTANIADNKDPKTLIEHLMFFESEGGAFQIGLERG
jgi:hypothetical protein